MQFIKFRGFKLHYANRSAAESMVRQIDEFPTYFTPRDDRPLIIDGGANIGVSMLYWKTLWPGAQIICFEPDPFTFKILQKNVDSADLPGITCIQAALAEFDGSTDFFGDISAQGDSRGNSIDAHWGARDGSSQTTVTCKRLSSFIAGREVAFLKLDVEGAEQRVLTESVDHLHRIQAIYVEVHETRHSLAYNSAAAIGRLLDENGFVLDSEARFYEHSLPPHLDDWRRSTGARQIQLRAWRPAPTGK